MEKNLKPVPADKQKSLGKLPTDVRNKMGYAKKGSMVKARYGTMAKGDVKKGLKKSSEFKSKLENFKKDSIKRIRGAQVGPAEEAKLNKMMPSVKDSPDTREAKMKAVKMKLSKLKTGGEMKKPMKAGLGKMVKKLVGSVFGKKSSTVNPTPGGQIMGEGKTPLTALYQKVTEQKTAKKSMGGEMKQGYGAARTSGMGLQDEDLIPGKSMDYYKDLM